MPVCCASGSGQCAPVRSVPEGAALDLRTAARDRHLDIHPEPPLPDSRAELPPADLTADGGTGHPRPHR